MDGRTWCQPRVWFKSRVTKRCTGREEVGKMTHQPTVTKNYKNTQSKFDSSLGSCDVSVAPRSVRLSSSSGTQLLLLPKGNSEVPLLFHSLNYPPYVCKPFKNCNPAALITSSPTVLFKEKLLRVYIPTFVRVRACPRYLYFPDHY